MRIAAPLLALSLSSLALATAPGCAVRADFPDRPTRHGPVAVAPSGPEAGTVAAEVVGKSVTVGDIDQTIAEQLASARAQYEMTLYEARKAALDARIQDELYQAEAGRRGITVEALVAAEVDAKAPAPNDGELQAFYEQYKDQMEGASFEQMRDRIAEHLSQQRKSQRQSDFLAELRKRHGVKVLLEPPRVEVEAKGPARGPADAKVTIVIFSDFECPFCARAEPTLKQVAETWPKDVRFVFRHYPLPFHASARPAAEAAACADEQGQFWPLHDHLFASGELEPAQMRTWLGQQSGFDLGKFDDCLSSGRGAQVVAADVEAAGKVQVDSTPHFFINGVRVSGAQPFEQFQSVIESELSR